MNAARMGKVPVWIAADDTYCSSPISKGFVGEYTSGVTNVASGTGRGRPFREDRELSVELARLNGASRGG